MKADAKDVERMSKKWLKHLNKIQEEARKVSLVDNEAEMLDSFQIMHNRTKDLIKDTKKMKKTLMDHYLRENGQ